MKELDLFNIIKLCYIPDLEKSEKQYSSFDCYSLKYRMDIELKCRRTHYDDLILEKKKYDALMERAQEFGTRAFYINSTPKGIYSFNLSALTDLEWEMKYLPRKTDFPDRRNIEKEITMLPIELATRLDEEK